MRTSTSIRIDNDAKEIATAVLKQYGMSLSDGINLFCKQVALTHSIPFELKVPSERMKIALQELEERKGEKFTSMEALKRDLEMILEVTEAHYAGDYKIKLVFNHTIERLVDLSSELEGEIFEPLHNLAFFQSFFIDCSTISWSNGADIAPEYLYFISKSNSTSPSDHEKEIEESVRSLYTLERAG